MHAASATAREKVEAAGGTVTLLREPKVRKKKHKASTPRAEEAEVDETPRRSRAEPPRPEPTSRRAEPDAAEEE